MKQDEKDFLVEIFKTNKKPREIINSSDFEINYKRAWFLLRKWCDKDIYDYGVTLDLGWLTEDGECLALKLLQEGIVNNEI